MTAIILSIGDELVLGQTVDTNSAWLSQQLAAIGISVVAHVTVADEQEAIEKAIKAAVGVCDTLLISGGIGPTEDDLTRQALAAVMNEPLELNPQWIERLESYFTKLGRTMPAMNRIQAMIPRGAQMIDNPTGTAAGIDATVRLRSFLADDLNRADRSDLERLFGADNPAVRRQRVEELVQQFKINMRLEPTRVFVMPGVPREMKIMFESYVLPILKTESGGAVILSRTLHTFGQGESTIAEKLGPLMKRDRNPSVGTTVSAGIVSLRVNSRFPSRAEAQSELDQTVASCRAALSDMIYGEDDQTLASIIAMMLTLKKQTVSTAESCTGGLLAKMLTDISGSSSYFTQGWVTYSNNAKRERLGVSENILNVHGAVSEPVVSAMAASARRLAKSDYALAISGIAGPTGGTPAKPVGTVCIALASVPDDAPPHSKIQNQNSKVQTRTFTFPGDRDFIRDRSAKMALAMLRFHLLGKPMPF